MVESNDIKLFDVQMPVFFRVKSIFATTPEEAKMVAYQRLLGKLELYDMLGLVLVCPDASEITEDDSDEAKEFIDNMKKLKEETENGE